jgi:hypothetical protein
MGGYSGAVTHPATGRLVRWQLAPGLADLARQLDRLRIGWYSIGDAGHLRRQGGHTPWKPGAPFGTVTAIDVMKGNYPDVERRILRLMNMDSYDTTWIDFINTNYHQWDWNGRSQGGSGDGHLHLEVLGNRTKFSSMLFYDMFGYPAGVEKPAATPPMPPTPPASTVSWKDYDMLKLVKLRSADEVYLSREDGKLQHLSPAQFKAAQNFNLKCLPSGAGAADKSKVTEAYVVENEAELALFGNEIVPLTGQVEGLD